jgi:glycosyltransferase involved in cell wall biosynthesis
VRIVQLLEFNQFNTGSVHQMFQAAAGLRERGHDVTIVSRPGAEMAERAAAAGVGFVPMPLRNEFDPLSLARLVRLFRARKPDIVHTHKGVAHSLALAAAYAAPVGGLVVNRGVSFPLDRWNRAKFRARRVDRVVTVCEVIKRVIVESGRLPPEKVAVVYAGTDVALFDPERWDPGAFRRETSIGDDRIVVAQVGLRDWKGWMELIDAAMQIAPTHPSLHLALIGCRHDRERGEVLAYARERGAAGRVSIVEVRTDMPNVLAAADLVVDASWAGTGITGTIREAMAMRKPVIATDCGGNRELVSGPEVGWLVPPRDAGALARALAEVIDQRERAAAVARNAREHVARGFSKELRITRLEDLYASILGAPPSAAAGQAASRRR